MIFDMALEIAVLHQQNDALLTHIAELEQARRSEADADNPFERLFAPDQSPSATEP